MRERKTPMIESVHFSLRNKVDATSQIRPDGGVTIDMKYPGLTEIPLSKDTPRLSKLIRHASRRAASTADLMEPEPAIANVLRLLHDRLDKDEEASVRFCWQYVGGV